MREHSTKNRVHAAGRKGTPEPVLPPRWRSLLHLDAAFALEDSAPMQKHIVDYTGLSRGKVSEMCAGVKPSRVTRFLEWIEEATLNPKASAGSMIAVAMLHAQQAAAKLPVSDLVENLQNALEGSTLTGARENVATHRLAAALGCLRPTYTATPEELAELKRAGDEHRPDSMREMGKQIDAEIYRRALWQRMGWA